ncbi:MAG: ABC transporter permease [Pseudobutyrivibrio ruminis]|nr:ABC transporter permease [Pseudobutyrivibrio ruminis]
MKKNKDFVPSKKNISDEEIKKQSQFKEFIKRLAGNKLALFGGIVFLILCLIAIFADKIAMYDYLEVDIANKYAPISREHLLGTDQYGRDIFSRVIYGGRWSLTLGLASTVLSTFLGIIVGSIAGYFGGVVDNVIMRIIDIVQCLPGILLTICIATVMGNTFGGTIFAMSFGGIWGTARMLRGQILTVRKQEYVEAARATNNSSPRIILKYVLPNSIQPIIINACMGVGGAIMGASSLSFLGLGVQPPLPEWGAMLNDARSVMRYYPNVMIAPLIFISLTVLAVSLFGDGLRDALDPRQID